jgi:hypothetical protein
MIVAEFFYRKKNKGNDAPSEHHQFTYIPLWEGFPFVFLKHVKK